MQKTFTKKEVLISLFWKLLERGGNQGINFLVSIILARLLLPKEFGLIALITIFITLANVFVQSGLNTALIQKKDADELDFSSVFYTSIFFAGILYIILFYSSPYIAVFYGDPHLELLLRVLSIILFFGAVNSIQIAIISRNMQFKKLFYSSLGAIIISGTVSVIMAYNGFGVWSLVVQQLTNQMLNTIIMWFTVKWRPRLKYSIKRMQGLLSYSWKILASNLVSTLFLDLRSLIIGKMYSAAMLGYFNQGKQFPSVIISNINGSIQSVMFPAYSSEQDNRIRVKGMVRRSIAISSFIVFPLMVGLAVIAEPLIKIVLTDKWLPTVPFLQIFCASYMLMPIHTANIQAIQALGYSGKVLKIELIKKSLELIVLLFSLKYGIYAIAVGTFITSLISVFINSYPNLKLLNYSYKEQIIDILPSFLLSITMGIIIYMVQYISFPSWLILIIQIVMGIIVYIILASISKIESYLYLVNSIRGFLKKRA